MRDPDPAVILDCDHVEHPQASGFCQTIDCPNFEPERHAMMEWASAGACALILGWVKWETGRGFIEILMDALPDLS